MPNYDLNSCPIGVFDSGLGGLTVLRILLEKFPQESFLYFGDTARLPYGSKSPDTIRKYVEQNLSLLKKQNVKAIVVACNSASSQVTAPSWENCPVFTVIKPGAQQAIKTSSTGRIAILGTRATIQSGIYQRELSEIASELDREIQLFPVSCPLFVPLSEEGWVDDPITNLIAFRYLQGLNDQQIDCAILGCTHYPILRNSIQKALGPTVNLVDSGHAVAETLATHLAESNLLQPQPTNPRTVRVWTSDYSPNFENQTRILLHPFEVTELKWIDSA